MLAEPLPSHIENAAEWYGGQEECGNYHGIVPSQPFGHSFSRDPQRDGQEGDGVDYTCVQDHLTCLRLV
jgi:hypothetical protein